MSTLSMHGTERRTPAAPLLRHGQRLTQPEFHRRYEQCPEDFKAELIGGIVYVASPMRIRHASHHPKLSLAFCLYEGGTPGVQLLDNATTILGPVSEPQPDLGLRILPEWEGQSGTDANGYVTGSPELLSEVSDTTKRLDLNQKKSDYEKAGVLEYLVWCIKERELHWFHFPSGTMIEPNRRSILRSRVFPGLWIHQEALFDCDTQRIAAVVQQGLASREHAAFVKRLQAARRKLSGGR